MQHAHEHHGCNCGGCGRTNGVKVDLGESELAMLKWIGECSRVPVANFILSSSAEASIRAIALAPVLIDCPSDTMADVKCRAAVLNNLVHKGLISLRDDEAILDAQVRIYRESELYKYFQQTVEEGSAMPGFLFDTASFELLSVVLTELGERVLG